MKIRTINSGGASPSSPSGRGDGADGYLEPLMSRAQARMYWFGLLLWTGTQIYFWSWWLYPEHVLNIWRFLLLSAIFAWITFQPAYFLVIFISARRTSRAVQPPEGIRVAMVVTKAPSEPFELVSRTLLAMLAQDHPHDTWLADEDPSQETLEWCAVHGVMVSTRRGRDDYHRATWPRRTRCKEGNLAFFYDNYGYDNYDFVAQLDADHVPSVTYLKEVLRPFADPKVGYVSAPSICSNNAARSWSARSRLFAEGLIHGAIQTGYSAGWAPLCIGSHYAVRTIALKEIGGLGPELAEDHSTTLIMNAGGWRGVHAVDAIAYGDGPETFPDFAIQEFQWSKSLFTILLAHSKNYIMRLPFKLRFQFLFCQLWYPIFSFFMICAYLIPIVAIVTGLTFANVTFPGFLLHSIPASVVLLWLFLRFTAAGWARPHDVKLVSWEGMLFLFARWPWVVAGIFAALRDWASGSFVDFRVTPKGSKSMDALPLRVVTPYFFLSLGSALPVIFVDDAGDATGFYIFAVLNAVIYALVFIVIIVQHLREAGIKVQLRRRRQFQQFAMGSLLAVLPVVGLGAHGLDGLDGITRGAGPLRLFHETYKISGAGHAGTFERHFHPEFKWDRWATIEGKSANRVDRKSYL